MKILLPLFLAVAAAAASAAEPVFSCRGNVPGNIQFAAGPVRLELRFENRGSLAGEVTELVRLADFHGNGEAPLRRRVMMEPAGVLEREIVIPAERRGAFRLTYSLMRNGELVFSREVTGAILEPVKALDPAGPAEHGNQLDTRQPELGAERTGTRPVRLETGR